MMAADAAAAADAADVVGAGANGESLGLLLLHQPALDTGLPALDHSGVRIGRRRQHLSQELCLAWAWRGRVVVGFASIFLGSAVNAIFVNANGSYGTAVITQARETNSQLNDSNIWEYDVVMKTADDRDVKTGFDTMSASLYPPRNAIEIPPTGERFVVKYIPGFERNIAIMRDESRFGKRLLIQEALGPIKRAAAQVAASPNNREFRREYREEIEDFLARHAGATSLETAAFSREELERLGN